MTRKYNLIAFFYLYLAFINPYSAVGQGNKFIFDHVAGEHTEYLNTVRTIFQDHFGYLWIGLNTGVVRYDGYVFKIYKPDINDSASFLGRYVTTFAEDHTGDIWIGTQVSGLYHYIRDKESFVHYSYSPTDSSSLSHNEIIYLYPDNMGYLWCVSDSRNGYLDRINPKSKIVERFQNKIKPDKDPEDFSRVYFDEKLNSAALVEDKPGSMWYALKDGKGLCYYDFTSDSISFYHSDEGNPFSLKTDSVYSLIKDNKDLIWIGTSKGLHSYNKETDNFIYYPEISSSGQDRRYEIYKMYKDSQGKLWLLLYSEVIRFNPENNNYETASILPREQRNYFNIIGEVPGKGIWIDQSNFTYQFYDFEQERTTTAQNILLNQSIYEKEKAFAPISSYLIDNSGLLWIAINQKGLYKEDDIIRTFKSYSPEFEYAGGMTNTPMYYVCEDPMGKIWFSSNRGIFYYDKERDIYHNIKPKQSGAYHLQKESLQQIISEENGTLWINTGKEGILTLNSERFNREVSFNIATDRHAYSSSVQGPGLQAAHAVDGDMTTRWSSASSDPQWIIVDLGKPENIGRVIIHWEFASAKNYSIQVSNDAVEWNTIYRITGRTENGGIEYANLEGSGRFLRIYGSERTTEYGYSIYEIEVYRKASIHPVNYQNSGLSGFPSDTIYNIQRDSRNSIWIISSKGLTQYDKSTTDFNTFSNPELMNSKVFEFYEDKPGIFWLIAEKPLSQILNFNPVTDTFRSYEFPDVDTSSDKGLVQTMEYFEDHDNRLWAIGKDSLNGDFRIYFFDRADDSFELKYTTNWNITGIVHEKNNLFWISLFARGIYLVDLEKGEVLETYDNTNGLNNLEIYSLHRYQSEDIWIQYRDGICRFNPTTGIFQLYNNRYGIQDIIYTNTLQSKSGHVYIPGMNGFNVFHPDSLHIDPNPFPPSVFITSLKIKGEEISGGGDDSILEKHISKTEQVDLNATQNVFTIGFTGFHYGLPEGNTYAVFMQGIDEDWNYIGTDHEVTYAGLSPGTYVFNVKSANADGVWNDKAATLSVIIHPPWIISWWAISGFVIIFFGLIYTSHRWRYNIHKKHLDKKQQELDEHKKLNERLKQVDELKDQFLANTSHELRTPLNGIIGLADSLRDGIAGKQSDKAIDFLNMITASGKRLANLINDILDFSKLKHNELKLVRKSVDVRSVVDIVITILRPLVQDKSVRISNNIQSDTPMVFADENRLQQILINLIGNAIKFTDEGSIVVSAESKEDFLAISVSDTGVGIPRDKLSEIFRSFEQLDMSISREYSGTGLGLAITKQLVELHKGTIEVESEPGKGSTFTLALPLSKGKISDLPEIDEEVKKMQVNKLKEVIDKPIPLAKEVETVSQERITVPEGEQINILIVDDEPVNLQVLDNYLSYSGYHVTKAKNGLIALDLLADKKKFDLVILDVMMPKMSGYEVCDKLREMYLPSELPIIMLTVRNTVADLVHGLNCGANDYLIKPFSKEELLSRVKTHIYLHRINQIANRFVPTKFLQSIGKNSIMEVKLGDYANLQVTVFFSDIRKYTTMSELMSPEENFKFIQAYVKRMGPIIQKHSGFINQYMGDAIMAIFPEDTHHALNAAIYMQKKIGEYNKARIKKGRESIVVGMGLHCGFLTMGIIGDENRTEPSTIADTVNIASRIEQMTKYFGARILFSESSYHNLQEAHRYHIRYLGNVHVKGKKETLKVFECFDGDDDEMIKLKMRSITDFDLAVKQFYNKDFPEAAVGFKKILKGNKYDLVAQNFYNHSVRFSHEGVPQNWTGVEMIDSDLL